MLRLCEAQKNLIRGWRSEEKKDLSFATRDSYKRWEASVKELFNGKYHITPRCIDVGNFKSHHLLGLRGKAAYIYRNLVQSYTIHLFQRICTKKGRARNAPHKAGSTDVHNAGKVRLLVNLPKLVRVRTPWRGVTDSRNIVNRAMSPHQVSQTGETKNAPHAVLACPGSR